ncbi:MAG: hypothetical protein VKI81_10765 [Synechococcaceae cyanobacterium]|nr:hypothetical protein [Synechococcaceae cyanobacterium]
MNWRWPERARIAGATASCLALGLGLAGCGPGGPAPPAGPPRPVGQREAEEAMPELKLFDPPPGSGASGGDSDLLPSLGSPDAPALGGGGVGAGP